MTDRDSAPGLRYSARLEELEGQRARVQRALRALSHARVAVFFLTVLAGLWLEESGRPEALVGVLIGTVTFLLLVIWHRRTKRNRELCDVLIQLNREGVSRLRRDWEALPSVNAPPEVRDHPYATNLHLFGRGSLTQLLGAVGSPPGAAVLREWLLSSSCGDQPSAQTVGERQVAVRELARHFDLRERVALHMRLWQEGAPHGLAPDSFLAWCEGEPWPKRGWLLGAARALPLITAALALLQAVGLTTRAFWLVPLVGQIGLVVLFGARIGRRLQAAFSLPGFFSGVQPAVDRFADARFSASMLLELQERLRGGQSSFRRLARLEYLADVRFSMLYLPLLLILLWDFHVLHSAERWRALTGGRARDWLRAIGEMEALTSLSTLAHDHPSWCYATLEPDQRTFHATALGHPLLPEAVSVPNDLTLGPPDSTLLITGSNMSGKTTLLRAIGLNVVLAQTGAPVCAESLRMPRIELRTVMHVHDSLKEGISTFMAELLLFKEIVRAARAAQEQRDRVLLFLGDEILQGTNAHERSLVARALIDHLLETGAITVVVSHDPMLLEGSRFSDTVRHVHFQHDLSAEGVGLEFDYTLRDGVATSTNAMRLLRSLELVPSDRHRHPHDDSY